MELKDFKAGVETLARFTNQRESEPEPFLVQIGRDGALSIISGDNNDIAIWRTGTNIAPDLMWGQKHGINSKTLTQAAKVLKGRGVKIQFSVENERLVVSTSDKGSIKLPYTEKPDLKVKPVSGDFVQFDWTDDEFDTLLSGVEASHAKSYPDGLVVQHLDDSMYYRFASTDSYKIFQMRKRSVDDKVIEPIAVRASFWNALRKLNSDAVTRFYENGVRVQVGSFEFSTGFLEAHPIWPDLDARYFPSDERRDVIVTYDRKSLIGHIKAVLPADKAEATTIAIRYEGTGNEGFVESVRTNESVGTVALRGMGTGRIEVSGKFLLEILNAINDNSVILYWDNKARYPIRVMGQKHLSSSFVLAPIVRV